MTTNSKLNNSTIDGGEDVFWSDTASDSNEPTQLNNKMEDDPHYKQGYVDGVSKFDNDVIQQNCDSTYRLGNTLGIRVGRLVGRIQYHLRDDDARKNHLLSRININHILQERNFDSDYKTFINENLLNLVEKELEEMIFKEKD